MEELNRRMQESDVACCPCNVTVGNTTIGPPLNPFWQVTSGECLLEDDCLTSPNFPENDGVDQACTIEITDEWVGYLDVHQFGTGEKVDLLYVNDVAYPGIMPIPLFNGVLPKGTIFWSADHEYNEAGFKICRTNVSVTGTTGTHQPSDISNQSYNEFWGGTMGDFYMDMDTSGCIASPEYPEDYMETGTCASLNSPTCGMAPPLT